MTPDLESILGSLVALAAAPNQVPTERLPDLVAGLARAQAALLSSAGRPQVAVHREPERHNEDRMLDVDEAAAMLNVPKRWLYRHSNELPFTRRMSARVVRFSRDGMQRWLATRKTLSDGRS